MGTQKNPLNEAVLLSTQNTCNEPVLLSIQNKFKLMGKKIIPILCSISENYFSYFSTKTYVVGTQKNYLSERVLLSTHNTFNERVLLSTQNTFKLMGEKIITILRSNSENYFFLFLNQNSCCGYSKELSQ